MVLPSTMQKTEQYWASKQVQDNWAESADLKMKGCGIYLMQKSSDQAENFGLIVSSFLINNSLLKYSYPQYVEQKSNEHKKKWEILSQH